MPPTPPATFGTVRLLRALLAATLIVPALLFAAVAWQERQVLMEEAARRAEKSAEVLEQHAAAAFHAYELIFARLDEHLQAVPGEDEQARHAYLAAIDHEQLKEVGSLFLIDAAGRVTAHSRFVPVKPTTVADRDYFQMLASGDESGGPGPDAASMPTIDASGLAIGVPNTGRLSGTPKLNIARAVRGPDGRFAGAVAISVAQDYFETFFRKLAASPEDSMVLVRADGTLLVRSPAVAGEPLQRALSLQNTRAVLARLELGTSMFTSPLDGIERVASYRKLADYPIYVGYGLSVAAVLATWNAHLFAYGAVALLAALTLFGVTWLALRAARMEVTARAGLLDEMARREKAEDALRQSQKMEAVGQLTGGVAHDFNNLLAAVLGNLELLAKRLPDDPRLHRYVASAIEGARRGASLTQRLLAFARHQDLKFEPVDVQVLVRGMADLLERSIGPTIAIETRFPVRLAPARADANQLEAALLNLAVNARDAMPDGGGIVVAGREEAVDADEALGLASGRYVVLSVRDTGNGMDAATLARAAEPFFTTKAVGKGTGLGLAMVHGLAAQCGGMLRLESAPGTGTTAELWLPVASVDVNRTAMPEPILERAFAHACRVLLVDDDALVLAGTAAMLEDLGHRVTPVGSAVAALAALRSGAGFDLLVTDQMMPGMTGLQLAVEVERLWPGLPILLASGYADLSETEAARLPRLAKPFRQADLAQAIGRLMVRNRGDVVVQLPRRAAEH